MKFPSFFSKKNSGAEYYFGLFLNSEDATGFVYESKNKVLSVIAQQNRTYSQGWDKILEDIDYLISDLEKNIDVHVTKTIFFLHSYLIDPKTQEIKDPYKDSIKNIAKSLELKPLGFIELHEAIKEYIKQRDEAPLNAILVELDTKHLSLYVYKGGKQLVSQHTPRSQSVSDDIQEILLQNNAGAHFPSKMILYGSEKLDDIIAELGGYAWKSQLFIHPPKIETLKQEELYDGMKKVFAEQMFEDVMTEESIEENDSVEENNSIMGFVIGEDVALNDEYEEKNEEVTVESTPEEEYKSETAVTKSKKITMPNMSLAGKTWLIMSIGVLIVLLAGAGAFEYFVHKVELNVMLPSQKINKDIDVTASIGESDKDFFVNENEITLDINDEKQTTGERDVGQKAKGEVMIHNFDNQEKTIAKGTTISSGNIQFTIDQEVKVASASGVTSSGTKQSGKSKVSATASEIGPESNIEKGKQLKIADLPDSLYVAIVEESFTGGTKKKVQTVAKKDLDALVEKAEQKAKNESTAQVKQSVKPGQGILADLTTVDLSETDYTKEVGEESTTVGIKAKAEIKYYTFPEKKFKDYILKELASEVPSGYKLQTDKVSYKVEDAEKNEDEKTITLNVQVADEAVKDISADAVTKLITGKTQTQLSSIVKNEFDAEDFVIKKVTPPIPFFSNWMPFVGKNIKVTISSR